jgi:hypothetical protein
VPLSYRGNSVPQLRAEPPEKHVAPVVLGETVKLSGAGISAQNPGKTPGFSLYPDMERRVIQSALKHPGKRLEESKRTSANQAG